MTDTPPPILWAPSDEDLERATLTRFSRWVEERRGERFDDYAALWRWSVEDLEGFWAAVWDFAGVRAHTPYERVLGRREMPGAEWFTGATLNYAEHVLAAARPGEPAIIGRSQTRDDVVLSWDELADQVARAAAGLRRLGVGRGDRVVAYLPNIPETVVALLAAASLGATWSSAAPEFGARSVVDRFAQIEPKVLFAVDGYVYGDKLVDRREIVAGLLEEMPSVEHVVLLDYLGDDTSDAPSGAVAWNDLLAEHEDLAFEPVPFDHPLWVLYSSGTTGLPKAIVQGHGGILLEQLKKGHLHLDMHTGDRMFWFTTTGWMMWNFVVGTLLQGATILTYDGNPGHPDMNALWDFVQDAGATCFGTSASYIASCRRAGIAPRETHDLSALRSMGSTGSPLAPEGFDWIYESVKDDVWLFSTSGGTDVCTAFVGGVPTLPVYEGELQARALGCAVESWDEDGNALVDEVGELVITEPMPSMPIFFWGDRDPDTGALVGPRYRESYFDTYPGVWRHGDWIRITSRGTAVITGRSDATINRQGVRMGTAELYRAVLAVPGIVDALVVDIPREGEENFMPLFVVLDDGVELDDALVAAIKTRVREDCSPRHVPNAIHAIAEVPRTLSGKALEIPVKKILMGTPPDKAASRESLANPAALDDFIGLAGKL
jgi:acetoacetyl-CoA synthetase